MKLTDKRLGILFILIIIVSYNCHAKQINTDSNATVNQSVFSVEKISEEEFIEAYRTSGDYNIYPQRVDSVAQYNVLNRVFQDAKERISNLDSDEKCSINVAVTDNELFCVNNLLYYPNLKLLGFMVPIDYHNNTVWWYDSTSGKLIDDTLFEPTAVNNNGIYVCQVLDDCDIVLDLHFFERAGNLIYEIQAYKNCNYSGDYYLYLSEEEHIKPIFWHKDNLLYLRSYDHSLKGTVYLKISLN